MFLAHVTQDAIQRTGGVHAVLGGLITSRHYKSTVKRTVLVAAMSDEDRRILQEGRPDLAVLPAQKMEDRTAAVGLAQIERRFGVKFYYGTRRYPGGDSGVDNEAEVLLIDVGEMPKEHARDTRRRLQDEFGLAFDQFRLTDAQDRYVRMTVPTYEALLTLRRSKDGPCVMLSHEWCGLPLGLWIVGRRDPRFRTVYYAHDVAPVRSVIEKHPALDLMFYSVMRQAQAQGKFLEDVFGSQESAFVSAIVMQAFRFDRIFGVSDSVVEELRFLGPAFAPVKIELVYNGVFTARLAIEARMEARANLEEFTRKFTGFRPNFLFTHVGRAVADHAFWRDLQVMEALDARLAAANEKAALLILASAAEPRTPEQVAKMEKAYGWPAEHRKGAPDLVGHEAEIDQYVRSFNRRAKASRAIFVNQVGFDRSLVGSHVPRNMTFADLRRGTDLEFALSAYEPFGIAPLEALPFGAICVLSRVAGCRSFVEKVDKKKELSHVLFRDYVSPQRSTNLAKLTQLTGKTLLEVEKKVAAELADDIYRLLPRQEKDRKRLLTLGYRYARQMSWEVVSRDYFLPALRFVVT